MRRLFILLICTMVSTSCRYNSSSSQIKESEISDYNSLSFGTLDPSVIDSFMNHSKSNHVLVEPGYYVWGLSVIKWNGEYHAYYSRWNRKYKFGGWMTHCEIVHAVADKPEGPWKKVTDNYATGQQLKYTGKTSKWTEMVSHGEVIRSGYNQDMEYDPKNCRWLISVN